MNTPRIDMPIKIDYTNWQGIRTHRLILPQRLVWGSNQWHKDKQWFVDATDAENPEKGMRYFALNGIPGWGLE